MSEPVDLSAARDARRGFITCPSCGGCYFAVAFVTLNPDGTAAGYSGTPICAECDAALTGLWPEPAAARPADTEEQTDGH